ncbi:MAG: hypothetical protein JWO37_383, partial [Acidimicrobiales bacterium]|nr:hypothetical protein [Acidimicrobiales bacterium]
MLASIHPLGERARGSRFAVTATAHVVASAAAGSAFGAILGTIGAVAAHALGRVPIALVLAAGAA